jgi:hypothetical protein
VFGIPVCRLQGCYSAPSEATESNHLPPSSFIYVFFSYFDTVPMFTSNRSNLRTAHCVFLALPNAALVQTKVHLRTLTMALWNRRNVAQLHGVTAQETTDKPLGIRTSCSASSPCIVACDTVWSHSGLSVWWVGVWSVWCKEMAQLTDRRHAG